MAYPSGSTQHSQRALQMIHSLENYYMQVIWLTMDQRLMAILPLAFESKIKALVQFLGPIFYCRYISAVAIVSIRKRCMNACSYCTDSQSMLSTLESEQCKSEFTY